MSASFVRSVNSLMTGGPFSDRGVQHTPFPSQSPDSEPGFRWLTRAVHRRALEARDVQEHRNPGLHSLSSSQPLTHTFVVALCANGAAIARPRDCSVGLKTAAGRDCCVSIKWRASGVHGWFAL